MCRMTTSSLLLVWLVSCGGGADRTAPNALIVSAASSLTTVLEPVSVAFERSSGVKIELNLAASSTLAAQLIAGAPVDLFISADQAQMNRVEAEGLIRVASRVDLLANQLVVVAPLDTTLKMRSPEGLGELAGRIALAEPLVVPAGVYARTYLESIGLWGQLQARLVPTRNVRAALMTVEAGEVDVGIVYRTDALSSDKVTEVFAVPIADGPGIRYPAAVTTGSANPGLAEQLLTYLRGPEAGARFEEAGFIVPVTKD